MHVGIYNVAPLVKRNTFYYEEDTTDSTFPDTFAVTSKLNAIPVFNESEQVCRLTVAPDLIQQATAMPDVEYMNISISDNLVMVSGYSEDAKYFAAFCSMTNEHERSHKKVGTAVRAHVAFPLQTK